MPNDCFFGADLIADPSHSISQGPEHEQKKTLKGKMRQVSISGGRKIDGDSGGTNHSEGRQRSIWQCSNFYFQILFFNRQVIDRHLIMGGWMRLPDSMDPFWPMSVPEGVMPSDKGMRTRRLLDEGGCAN